MEKYDMFSLLLSIMSLIVPLFSIIHQIYESRDELIRFQREAKEVNSCIRVINQNSALNMNESKVNLQSQDDYKIILYWYCRSIEAKLKEIYPTCDFCVSIKNVSGNEVSTILATGSELFLGSGVQYVKNNIEYNSIIQEGFDYFFVTDLKSFDNKKQKYISDDPEWKYKYNTSIVFPVKSNSNDENKIIGFICINSPQSLRKKKSNKLIIKLVEKTSENVATILANYL